MRSRWIVLATTVLIVGCAGIGPSPANPTERPSIAQAPSVPAAAPSASATTPAVAAGEAWIAYQSDRGYYSDLGEGDGIYLMRPDGTDAHELLPDATYGVYHPDWSPDGSRIAFDAETGGGNEVWVVDADGTDATVLVARSTDCELSCGDVALPARSPDGLSMAFVRYQLSDLGLVSAAIEVEDVADGDRRVVFRAPPLTALNYPRWSHDGRSLVFEMTRYPDASITPGSAMGSAIAVIDVDSEGAEPVILTDWSMYATYPDWHPRADEILFTTYDLGEFPGTDKPSNLYTMTSDGSGQTALTTFGEAEQRATQPTWTPDGERIIFALVGQAASFDDPRNAAFIDRGGSGLATLEEPATHPRLRPLP